MHVLTINSKSTTLKFFYTPNDSGLIVRQQNVNNFSTRLQECLQKDGESGRL